MFQRSNLKALGKAMLAGTLAGGGPPMVLMLISLLADLSMGSTMEGVPIGWLIYLVILPLLVAAAVVVPACVLIGIPIAALLKRSNDANLRAYVLTGAGAGFLVMLAIVVWTDGIEAFWLALLGAFSGGVAGYFWSREQQS